MSLPVSLGLFVLAGLCEIGGGYLVWLAIQRRQTLGLRRGRRRHSDPVWDHSNPPAGSLWACLCRVRRNVYRIVLLWGWGIDGVRPDRYDAMGAILCLAGMMVILYAPRT